MNAKKTLRAQGSLEYIMMLAAASIVIALALAMVVKLKAAVVTGVDINGLNQSISSAIAGEMSALAQNSV